MSRLNRSVASTPNCRLHVYRPTIYRAEVKKVLYCLAKRGEICYNANVRDIHTHKLKLCRAFDQQSDMPKAIFSSSENWYQANKSRQA